MNKVYVTTYTDADFDEHKKMSMVLSNSNVSSQQSLQPI